MFALLNVTPQAIELSNPELEELFYLRITEANGSGQRITNVCARVAVVVDGDSLPISITHHLPSGCLVNVGALLLRHH